MNVSIDASGPTWARVVLNNNAKLLFITADHGKIKCVSSSAKLLAEEFLRCREVAVAQIKENKAKSLNLCARCGYEFPEGQRGFKNLSAITCPNCGESPLPERFQVF